MTTDGASTGDSAMMTQPRFVALFASQVRTSSSTVPPVKVNVPGLTFGTPLGDVAESVSLAADT
jgi:hypothetical protein